MSKVCYMLSFHPLVALLKHLLSICTKALDHGLIPHGVIVQLLLGIFRKPEFHLRLSEVVVSHGEK